MQLENRPMISIIVPVYNVEKYISRCLESIKSQTFDDYEVIIVNDGATDNSLKICEEFVSCNEKFYLISQMNAGLSEARNTGIRMAKGKYIYFVDSDDYLVDGALSIFANIIINLGDEIDIILANAVRIEEGKCAPVKYIEKETLFESGKKYLINKISKKSYHPAVWMNIYHASLIKNNSIYFKRGRLHEDVEWLPRILMCAKKVYEVDKNVYCYVIRENSITTNEKKSKNGMHLLTSAMELHADIKFDNENEQRIFNGYIANLYMNAVYIGKLNSGSFHRTFPIKNANTFEEKIKAIIFWVNPKLYFYFRERAEGRR